jgi:hypothetical protein
MKYSGLSSAAIVIAALISGCSKSDEKFTISPTQLPIHSTNIMKYWECEDHVNKWLIGFAFEKLRDLSYKNNLDAADPALCYYTHTLIRGPGGDSLTLIGLTFYTSMKSRNICWSSGQCRNLRDITFARPQGSELLLSYTLTDDSARKIFGACVSVNGKYRNTERNCF